MYKRLYLSVICLLAMMACFAQSTDSLPIDPSMSPREVRRIKKLFSQATYPLLKTHIMTGVLPVTDIDVWPDTTLTYKLLFSWTLPANDSVKSQRANYGLTEIGRIINLHIANGIPRNHLQVEVVVHGLSLFSLLNDAAYKKQFHRGNPNAALVREMQAAGVHFQACGQAMGFLGLTKKDLMPGIDKGLTAQTLISSYQLKGYVLYNEDKED